MVDFTLIRVCSEFSFYFFKRQWMVWIFLIKNVSTFLARRI